MFTVLLSHSSSDYMAEVDEYSKNVTGIISQYLNNGKSHSITLNESEQSIATWITGNVEHLQQTDKVRVTPQCY